MPEKVNIVLKKDTTILKFEDLLDHGNGDGYLLDARLYWSLNDTGKTHSEGKSPGEKIIIKAEGMTVTKSNTEIKCETTGNILVNKK